MASNASKAARKLLDLLGANQKLKAMVVRLEDDLAAARTDLTAAVERAVEAEGLVEKAEMVRADVRQNLGVMQQLYELSSFHDDLCSLLIICLIHQSFKKTFYVCSPLGILFNRIAIIFLPRSCSKNYKARTLCMRSLAERLRPCMQRTPR